MFDRWIAFCLHNRGAVLVGSAVVALAGWVSFRQLTVEAFPDPTDTQVQVITLYPGQPAEEVERQIGLPLERALNGTPGLGRLRNLDLGFRMHPGHKPDDAEDLMRRIRSEPPWLAIGASVDVKFLKPVFAGQRLDYQVTLSGEVGNMMRFEVEAVVDDVPVAAGTMTGARMTRPVARQ